MPCIIPLDDLMPDQSATIVRLLSPEPMRTRLEELGFLPGRTIRLLHISPLGDPRAYEICGACIALRRDDTLGILIDILPQSGGEPYGS